MALWTIPVGAIHTFAVSCPGAVVAGRGVGAVSATSNTLDQLVTKTRDRRFELIVALGVPLGALSGDGITAGEGNEEHIVVIVARVTVDTLSVASRGQRDGSLANHGLSIIVTVLVPPNTIDLEQTCVSSHVVQARTLWSTYQLVTANHSHERQGLDAVVLRVESNVAGAAALVAKDDVWVNIGVQVTLALTVAADSVLERSLRLGVARASASAIISGTALDTIAVNIHVDELAVLALKIDDIVIVAMVATVRECCHLVSFAALFELRSSDRSLTAVITVNAVEAGLELVAALALALQAVVEVADVAGNITGRGQSSQ